MNVIVTGNAGFVGRNLTRVLLEKGHKVYGFDRLKTKDSVALKHDNFKQKKVDLCSLNSILKACKSVKDVKLVFHTVAIQPTSNEMEISEYLDINVRGAVNLLNACAACDFKKMIVSSSFSVYGKPEYLPMDEQHPVFPNNVYGLTKSQAELLFEFYARKKDFHIVVLRYDGIYGPGQTIPGFIQYLNGTLSKGEDIELFNEGRQRRDNVYVGDVVQANLKAMRIIHKQQYNVFNIGGGEPKTSFQAATIIKKALKSKSQIIRSKKGNALMNYDVFMDSRKARRVLGYKPRGLRENITRMTER